ncbi:MAG: hypothetical protein GC192_15820 [Bacteroidetes bacterium]|nr:hypothetical protein [Bacteroidota bacterium]
MRILSLVLAYLLTSCQLADPPKKVLKAFENKYPKAEKVSWNIDRNGRHEADFTLDGTKYRADFDADGTWVETETSVKWDDLPKATKSAFKDEDKKKDIVEIELVDSHEKGHFYDIEYKTSGHKQDIMITPDGQVLGTDTH